MYWVSKVLYFHCHSREISLARWPFQCRFCRSVVSREKMHYLPITWNVICKFASLIFAPLISQLLNHVFLPYTGYFPILKHSQIYSTTRQTYSYKKLKKIHAISPPPPPEKNPPPHLFIYFYQDDKRNKNIEGFFLEIKLSNFWWNRFCQETRGWYCSACINLDLLCHDVNTQMFQEWSCEHDFKKLCLLVYAFDNIKNCGTFSFADVYTCACIQFDMKLYISNVCEFSFTSQGICWTIIKRETKCISF